MERILNLMFHTSQNLGRTRYGRTNGEEGTSSYYRARYYDAAAGRFLSEDPIRFVGGANFYSYVANNSVRRVDPSGLIHQAWFEKPFDGRLHDDPPSQGGGLEVLCKKGRNKQQDKLMLAHSIAVRFLEIVREGEDADYNHISRLVDEAITLAFCDDSCGDEKPEPKRVPDTVNEHNWWQQFQQMLKQNPFVFQVL